MSAVHNVLSETCLHHDRYNPGQAQFTTYVIDLIMKRMATLQRRQFLRIHHEENISEKSPEPMYNDSEDAIVRRIDRRAFFQDARQHLSETEAAFLDLMLEGEIHLERFGEILTRSDTVEDVAREVNRVKARLKYKLRQAAQVRGLRFEDLI